MTQKSEKQPVLTSPPDKIPCYQYDNRRGLFLNLRLDVEIDGVTYHLVSRFSEKPELGEVLDTIELERSQRQTA